MEVVGLIAGDTVLMEKIIEIRQQYRLKLPDAVIAAMVIESSANLITADQEFAKVKILTIVTW